MDDFNDCSINADCINLRGSYSCRCRAGYRDKSPKKHRPGRDCYGKSHAFSNLIISFVGVQELSFLILKFHVTEMLGCPECNYKGHCRINAYGEPFCECFRWFGGSKCHINLKSKLKLNYADSLHSS